MSTPQKADENYARNNGDTSVIPKGLYCYTPGKVTRDDNGVPSMAVTLCPYWAKIPGAREQEDGYCALLQSKNADGHDDGLSLLWDQVKECGINDDFDEDEDEIEPWRDAANQQD